MATTAWRVPANRALRLTWQRHRGSSGRMHRHLKCLTKAYRILSNVLSRREVILHLLSSLEHKLEGATLMQAFERLNDTVFRKVTTKPHLQASVKTVHELVADAYWEIPLAVKWVGGTHDLLVIRLNSADNLGSRGIEMDLVDVLECSVRLRAVARAQLCKECGTDRRAR